MTSNACLLRENGMEPTDARLRILEALSGQHIALRAQDILKALRANGPFDKVTLYRTLEAFAERSIVQRHCAGDRTYRYCMPAPDEGMHSHFYCTRCGNMACLTGQHEPGMDILRPMDAAPLPGRLHAVEIRLDGICDACLSRQG